MALTADQTALLQTAIENLNKSVEVNQEILEICKSVGNTGVVDIATHNNDKNAHSEGFNNVIGKYIYSTSAFMARIDPKGAGENTTLGFGKFYVESNTLRDRSAIQLFAGFKGENKTDAGVIRFYLANEDFSNSFSDKELGSISFYSRYGSEGSAYNSTTTMVAMRAGTDAAGSANFYIGVRESGGTNHQYYFSSGMFNSNAGDDLGSSTYKWKDCYLNNSPIVSSDKRLKQDFDDISEEVFKAWSSVKFQVYKFKDAVAKKGSSEARKHIGLIAQDIIQAFKDRDLDAFKYGIVCYDSWEDQYQQVEDKVIPEVLNEKGEVITPEQTIYKKELVKPAGDIYTVRYEEALALECAYQRWKLQKIESALANKGIVI